MQEFVSTEDYVPGNCNIGTVEIKRRYRLGYIGAVLVILFIILAETLRLPHSWKLLLFIPVSISLSGFLQAWQKFCFVYGYRGVFSITGRRQFSKVKNADIRKDRNMAINLVSRVLAGSTLITLLYYFLS